MFCNCNASSTWDPSKKSSILIKVRKFDIIHQGCPMLHWAVDRNSEILEYLLPLVSHQINQRGQTPINRAIYSPSNFNLLVEYKADLTLLDNRGRSRLHNAAASQMAQMMSILKSIGTFDPEACDNDGNTPIMLCQVQLQDPTFHALIEHFNPNVNLRAVNSNGLSMMHHVCLIQRSPCSRYRRGLGYGTFPLCCEFPLHQLGFQVEWAHL